VKSFWTAFLLIFVAELGDKTQFMTLALSSRYKALTVFIGIALGTMSVSLVSVLLGRVLGNFLPQNLMSILAGLIFIVFGILSLRQSKEEEITAATETSKNNQHLIWLTIACTFFIAELADKTMIATIALASRDDNYFAIWAGSTLGLLVSNSMAIGAGKALTKYVTGKAVPLIAATIYILAGLFALKQGLLG
jgi:putative Ca2+/H+ antiporter (TMEM165/GDT1 family)